jgi:hypothetical protein
MTNVQSLVVETATHYNRNNRSLMKFVNDSTPKCCYVSAQTGDRCAVGRCLTEKGAERFSATVSENMTAVSGMYFRLGESEFSSCFKKKYQGIHLRTWEQLQEFHDENDHWDDKGVTDSGIRFIRAVWGGNTSELVRRAYSEKQQACNDSSNN